MYEVKGGRDITFKKKVVEIKKSTEEGSRKSSRNYPNYNNAKGTEDTRKRTEGEHGKSSQEIPHLHGFSSLTPTPKFLQIQRLFFKMVQRAV